MPLELRPETEAYRLCQPMHVLSFGEGRCFGKGCVLPSPLWDGTPRTIFGFRDPQVVRVRGQDNMRSVMNWLC